MLPLCLCASVVDRQNRRDSPPRFSSASLRLLRNSYRAPLFSVTYIGAIFRFSWLLRAANKFLPGMAPRHAGASLLRNKVPDRLWEQAKMGHGWTRIHTDKHELFEPLSLICVHPCASVANPSLHPLFLPPPDWAAPSQLLGGESKVTSPNERRRPVGAGAPW